MARSWIKRLTLAASISTVLLAPATSQAETLSDAMISAYQTSNLLDQQRALLRAADENVVQAGATLRPVLNFIANGSLQSPAPALTGDQWSANASLNLSLTIFDNGQTRYAVDAAKETVLGLRGALKQFEQQVLLSTVQAYMDMILNAQLVSISSNNVRVITQELRAARERFQVGEVTRTDVSLAEARLAAARGNLAAARGNLEIARETYKAVVGTYPGNLRWPTNPPMPVHSETEAKAFAVRNHPSIEEAQRNVNAQEATVLRAQAAFGPRVSGSSSVTFTEGFDSSFNAGVRVNVPIYSGGTLRSVKRQSVANRDASRSALLQTVINVKQEVGIAWANLAVAAARVEASRRQVSAGRVAFEGVREEARFGSRTTLDVLNAEQDLLDARANLITSEVQQYVSLYALLSSMGLLTSEKLGLGIPTYDPVEYYRYATGGGSKRVISPEGRALDRVMDALKR
jgi:outer membrane protein